MPPEFTILTLGFGFGMLSTMQWFSAYGGGTPPVGTAIIEDHVNIGMRVGVTEREVMIGGF